MMESGKSLSAEDKEHQDELEKYNLSKKLKLPANPELDNFLCQVDEISEVIHCLSSNDPKANERGLRRADILLQSESNRDVDEDKVTVKSNRTVINTLPEKKREDEGSMSQEGFMRMVEKDAKERAEDRKMRKEKSDKLLDAGIQFFREQNYAAALDRFNKALDWTKDSALLYNNRALTYIRLKIYSKAIEDCDKAIFISENNLKARLYKAKAHFLMGDVESCRKLLKEASETNPDSKKMIQDYQIEMFGADEL